MKYQSKNYLPNLLLLVIFNLTVLGGLHAQQTKKGEVINMVFTSDVHYGITRHQFRGDTGVASVKVNAAMINQINLVPALRLPDDGGVDAGHRVEKVSYLLETGDISNRMEPGVETAAMSWAEFDGGYLKSLKLKGNDGLPAKVLMVPGNHDATNAIGSYKPMKPVSDPTTMVHIYNLMMKPQRPLTNASYNYEKDKVDYSREIGGIHLMFITIWPDSAQRIWMEKDLAKVNPKTPVIIFAHDPPTGDVKHFTNPKGGNVATPGNQFEFLVSEKYKDAERPGKDQTDVEQRGWVKFLKQHPNIKAYFHGHSNWNEFYTYKGPDNDVSLPVFRVDSPMKGKFSSKDETKLSFQLISLDPVNQLLTVRECLWNTHPDDLKQGIVLGERSTISLKVN